MISQSEKTCLRYEHVLLYCSSVNSTVKIFRQDSPAAALDFWL
jgi:hypothetical protein